jgi:hypothetical protein
MNIYLVWLLRIIHIVAGVFWVGGTLIMTFFVGPTVGATGEAGQKFVGHLMNNLKFSNRMAVASGLTILAGAILYWDRLQVAGWVQSNAGRGFGIGAAFAIIGFIFGMMIGRNLKAMLELGAQIQGKPSPEQIARMQALQKRQATVSMISVVSVLLATVFMAIARYL